MIQKIIDDLIIRTDVHLRFTHKPKVKCVFINTDETNQASETYIRNKSKILQEYGMESETITIPRDRNNVKTYTKIRMKISELNADDSVKGIVLQLPLCKSLERYTEQLLNSIDINKDVDGLCREKMESDRKCDLPITAEILYDILQEVVKEKEWSNPKIYLRGMGKTTNGRLFNFLLRNYGHIRVCNSKTSEDEDKANLEWADIIISSTGVGGCVHVFGKIFISPTIMKNSDGKWINDLHPDCRDHNDTHKVTGTIGKLTCLYLAKRCLPSV